MAALQVKVPMEWQRLSANADPGEALVKSLRDQDREMKSRAPWVNGGFPSSINAKTVRPIR